MAQPPTEFTHSQHEEFPDDHSSKDIFLSMSELALIWYNGELGSQLAQIVKLSGHTHYAPLVVSLDDHSELLPIGRYDRSSRNRILDLAAHIKYSRRSITNGAAEWFNDLLHAVVEADLLDPAGNKVVERCLQQLPSRKPELPIL